MLSSTVTQAGNTAAGMYGYTYDSGARLRSMTVPGGAVTAYSYDAGGNRLTAGASVFSYDQRNRLVSGAGTAYKWSARGTLSSTTGTGAAVYAFDGLDRLTQAGSVTYGYDSLDRVTTRTVAGVPSSFSYAGMEKDPVSEGVNKYHRGPSGASVVALTRGSTMVMAGSDRHGDVSFTLNAATGAVTDTSVRDPWGRHWGLPG